MNDAQDEPHPGRNWVWSTRNVAVDEWRDVACSLFPGLSIDWLDDQPKRAWMETGAFADAQFVEIDCMPCRIARTPWPAWRDGTYTLVLQFAGTGHCRHAGRDVVQESGDLILFDHALPLDIVYPENYHLLIWELPRDALAPMLAAPDCSVAWRLPTTDGPGAVLGTFARALMTEGDRCDASTQRSLLMHLCGLTALTVGASPLAREREQETRRAVRRQQILTYIETHFRDADFTAERAAGELGISQRWLHAVLEDSGISFAARVVCRRLEACRQLLDDPAYDHLSIGAIALLCGFRDLSTFNRRFRAQYGMTPRDARHLRTPPDEAPH